MSYDLYIYFTINCLQYKIWLQSWHLLQHKIIAFIAATPHFVRVKKYEEGKIGLQFFDM